MNLAILSLAVFTAFVGPTVAAPLTCETFSARLWVKTQVDTSLSDRVRFTADVHSLEGVHEYTLAGYGAKNIRLYCGDASDLRIISLRYDTNELNRPSVFSNAKAIIADIPCTLVKAPMEDWDFVTSQMFSTAVSAFNSSSATRHGEGHAMLYLAPDSWRMLLSEDRSETELNFSAGDASSLEQAPMHLGE